MFLILWFFFCCCFALTTFLLIGELFFFRLCNRLLCSYLEPGLAPLERLKLAFAAMFMSEGWFTHLKEVDKKRKDVECIGQGRGEGASV